MSLLSIRARRILSVVVGACVLLNAGNGFVFSVVTNAVKKKYNYTQTEMAIMAGFANFGAMFALPAGVVLEKFGPRWLSLGNLVLSLTGYMLLWSATKMTSFYKNYAWLQYIYFFIAYFSTISSYIVAFVPNVRNFPPKHRGTILSFVEAMFSIGTSVYVALYGACFVHGHEVDAENQDIAGFFLMLAITGVVTNCFGAIFIGDYQDTGESAGDSTASESTSLVQNESRDLTGCALLREWDFQFLFWSTMLCASVVAMYLTNVNVYLRSFDMEKYSTLFNVILPVLASVSKASSGTLSDRIIHKVPRTALLLGVYIVVMIAMISLIFFADDFYVLLIGTCVVGFGFGTIYVLVSAVLSELYGVKYLGRNWGMMLTCSGAGTILLQEVYGTLYDAEIPENGGLFCYGLKCFRWSFTVTAVLTLCAVIMVIGLMERQKRRSRPT